MRAKDGLVHCFRKTLGMEIYALHTVCGKQYYASTLAMWPQDFMELIGQAEAGETDYELCPECVNHEDLPMAVLGAL